MLCYSDESSQLPGNPKSQLGLALGLMGMSVIKYVFIQEELDGPWIGSAGVAQGLGIDL